MTTRHDVAVAGAGILGLAHAYHLARRGLRVVVFERQPRAQGASVRNFGMLWPIGQPPGPLYRLARRSLEIWQDVLRASGLWHAPVGSLHLAHHEDEAAVLREFVAAEGKERSCTLLTAAQITDRFPVAVPAGLRCGLWSPVEVNVDPRQVIAELPAWLQRTYGVEFHFGTPVLGYDRPRVITVAGEWHADRLLVCTGADFREVAPDAFAAAGLVPCKLQMLRGIPSEQDYFRVGTMLAAGLTLRHYRAFAACPSLPALCQRFDRELPQYGEYGIHVLLAENASGELVIGDSHEYGDAIEPFDKPEIDNLILRYLRTFVTLPDLRLTARWHGIYVKHPTEPYVCADPRPGLRAVTGVGGMGMTLSFGLAEQVIADWLGGTGNATGRF
jgi:FAD dependent oxidoreductase TIGR03364